MRFGSLMIVGSMLVAACGGEEASAPGTWEVDHLEDGAALVSVWGSGAGDVWAAGGTSDRGLVLHSDGTQWTPVDSGATSMLWWVYGFTANDVYAVGEHGLILHFDGQSWQRAESGVDTTLYGVWGASGDDVWIVGGDAEGEAGSAVVLRGSGLDFEPVTDLPSEMAPSALFKIYGYGADDVMAVGASGTVLRYDGAAWSHESTPTDEPLFSLWGRAADDLYAVGGYAAGEILHFDGTSWQQVDDLALDHGLSGVFTGPEQPMIAVGASSTIVEIAPDGSEIATSLPSLDYSPWLHGVWGDENGTTYAVGGDLNAYPDLESGVILRSR